MRNPALEALHDKIAYTYRELRQADRRIDIARRLTNQDDPLIIGVINVNTILAERLKSDITTLDAAVKVVKQSIYSV